jgi:hypothetical protein
MTEKHPSRRGDTVSLGPQTVDDAADAVFQIKAASVRKMLTSKPVGNK